MTQRKPVLFYTRRAFCPDVARARAVLEHYGVPYEEHVVDDEPEAAAYVRQVNGGVQRVPVLVVGERILVEPGRRELTEALKEAGYLEG